MTITQKQTLKDLAAVRHVVERNSARLVVARELLELLMGLFDDLSTDQDVMLTSVTGIVNAYIAQAKTIADMDAQIKAGPPGLTADQATAIHARFAAANKQIADALAPAGVVVTPTTPTQPAP